MYMLVTLPFPFKASFPTMGACVAGAQGRACSGALVAAAAAAI
jgi:hypothetical protein